MFGNSSLEARCEGSITPVRETIIGRLRSEQSQLSKRLENVNKALSILEDKPEIAEALEALHRVF